MVTKTQKPKLTREEKALEMFTSGVIVRRTEGGWEVPGSNGNSYEVQNNYDVWNCTCPDFLYRGGGELCKHIHLVLMIQEMDKLYEQIVQLVKKQTVVC